LPAAALSLHWTAASSSQCLRGANLPRFYWEAADSCSAFQADADSKLLSSSLDSSRQQLLGLPGLGPQQVFVGALAVPLEAVLELGGELAKAAVQ